MIDMVNTGSATDDDLPAYNCTTLMLWLPEGLEALAGHIKMAAQRRKRYGRDRSEGLAKAASARAVTASIPALL